MIETMIHKTGALTHTAHYSIEATHTIEKLSEGQLNSRISMRNELLGYIPFYGTAKKYDHLLNTIGLGENVSFRSR